MLIISCSDLDIDIVDNGDGTVSIYYNVKDAGEYTVSIKFGGQPVSGGFYTFTVSQIFYIAYISFIKILIKQALFAKTTF